MGYACPVCEHPQADAIHLANHLAFTALLRGGAHEAWLDEHAPGWADDGETALAERLEPAVSEESFPQVFEDTTDADVGGDGGGLGHEASHEHDTAQAHVYGRKTGLERDIPAGERVDFRDPGREEAAAETAPEEDVATVLREARELTEQRRSESETE